MGSDLVATNPAPDGDRALAPPLPVHPSATEVTALAVAPPEVGGLPLFRLEYAAELRRLIDSYQTEYLREEHYVWYASWLHRGHRRRKGFDTRNEAEAHARRTGGRVECKKRAEAYDILAMPLNICSEPAPEFDRDSSCRAHDGAHVVYTRGWRVSLPGGRYQADRGTVAECERMSEEEGRFWGRRVEHDPQRLAERRAYVRAISHLLGFGEPAPYLPDGAQGVGTDTPPSGPGRVELGDGQENVNRAWSAFWATARGALKLSHSEVHAIFRVPDERGALLTYAEQRAQELSTSIVEYVAKMREHLLSREPLDPVDAPHPARLVDN